MSASKVRIGIVGTSGWTELMFLNSLPSHPQAEIVAVCGRNGARTAEFAAKHGIPQVFTDYRDMIANGKLDALVVATPDDSHYPITMAALDAGLHVLCEKPLAMNAVEARAMYEKADAAGVTNMVVFTWRYPPQVRYMSQLLAEGYVGRPYHAELRFITGFNRGSGMNWRLDPQRSFGEMADHGSHMLDLARLFLGDITRVNAHLANNVSHVDAAGTPVPSANDTASGLIEFASGAQGTFVLSSVAYLADWDWEQTVTIYGESGTLQTRVVAGSPDKVLALYGAHVGSEAYGEITVPDSYRMGMPPGPFLPTMLHIISAQPVGPRLFVDSILSGQPGSPTFYDGYRAQLVIDAALESHRLGQWVTVPER